MQWSFRCYVNAAQRRIAEEDRLDVVDQWVAEIADDAFEAMLEQRLRFLAQQPRLDWKMPTFRPLHGNAVPLGELRIKHKGVQRRLLGANTGDREFTWLLGTKEKGGKFEPKSSCETALKRLAEVKIHRSYARACDHN